MEEWHPIPPIEFQAVVESMPKHIEAVIAACGGPTPLFWQLLVYTMLLQIG